MTSWLDEEMLDKVTDDGKRSEVIFCGVVFEGDNTESK